VANGVEIPLTVSLGVAVLSGTSDMGADEGIDAADAALYRAKAAGRNRAVLADAPAEAATNRRRERRPAREAGRVDDAPVEVSRLREVSIDDDALRGELLDLFVVTTASRLPSLRSALASGDAGLAESEARAIKGESSHLGASRLGDLAFRLERACRGGIAGDAPAGLLREIEAEFDRVRAFVDQLATGPEPGGGAR
jgi:HPt (histidine-containing phosphotransfer) domain-containing protein